MLQPTPTAQGAVFESGKLAFSIPHRSPHAVLLVAHGCRASARVWFDSSPPFGSPLRSPLPEETCITRAALASGYAVVAASSAVDCWRNEDIGIVAAALERWRRTQALLQLPLFVLGTSSGGWFATQVARHWTSVVAVCSIVSVPTLSDIQPPLPRGVAFPPLQLVMMRKDSAKLKEGDALLAAARANRLGGGGPVEALVAAPRQVGPGYFSERMALTPNHSAAVLLALRAAGHVDGSGLVTSHPRRGSWRETVQKALPAKGREGLPQRSLQVAMDGIFQELDVAYASHANTCEHVEATLAFFARHSPRPQSVTPHKHSHRSKATAPVAAGATA